MSSVRVRGLDYEMIQELEQVSRCNGYDFEDILRNHIVDIYT